MSNKDWIDYTNLTANIHQSIKLGEISNQISQLTSINTAMLGNMNNLVSIEVYKLEQEENEKHFKQFLFNLKKFVKDKYDEPLTIALLKNGHCKLIDSLLDNFQKDLSSFEDKEYVESIRDSFNEYLNIEIDFESLSKESEDEVSLFLSYLMFTNDITASVKELSGTTLQVNKVRGEYYSPLKHWTWDEINEHMEMIGSFNRYEKKPFDEYTIGEPTMMMETHMDAGEKFQFLIDDKKVTEVFSEKMINKTGLFSSGSKKFRNEIKIREDKVLDLIGNSEEKIESLSSDVKNSIELLKNEISKSNAEWLNVEKKLIGIFYDTTLPIQGPYQYRKQVIG